MPANLFRIFRLAGAVIAGLVGIIFVAVGIGLIISHNWTVVSGTVQSCSVSHVTHTNGSSLRVDRTCVMTWQVDGQQHTGTVDFGNTQIATGQTKTLRAHGDSAVLPTPTWAGYAIGALGLALIALAVFVLFRRRRRTEMASPITITG